MTWNSGQRTSSGGYQSANFGGRDFWLVPKVDGGSGFPSQTQAKHPELLRFDDPELRKYLEYEYTNLPGDKKRIRLMKLYAGEVSGMEIYCELIEVEYDNKFHIPTKTQETEAQGDESENSRDEGTDHEEDEGNRSDLEKRWQEKTETAAEELARKKRQEVRDLVNLAGELKKDHQEEKRKETEKLEERIREWKKAKKNEEKYEALSWCWGDEAEDYALLIKKGRRTFRKRVRKELALALKNLRRAGQERTLWIDAICINQDNPEERNHQVQMMSRVYTRARQVCVWLGEADTESEIAIKFIKYEMKELKNFDTISSDEQYSRKWRALMSLMQRDWFFRRWVVQEIALARAATVYCGPHSVPWKSFAVAVELFVEVETATHRLSEVMKRDEKFRHVPGWFEYVSELGASLLVQATGKVFRTKKTPLQHDADSSDDDSEEGAKYDKKGDDQEEKEKREKEEEQQVRNTIREAHTIDPLERRSLLSLEYLVSTMFIFQASEPRDVVYALLAIARDASPFAPAQYGQDDQKLFLVMTLLDNILAEKPFEVDYNRPYSDVSRDFVEFCIARKCKTDGTQALDILCRPWALEPKKGRSIRLKHKASDEAKRSPERRILRPKRKSWKKRESGFEKNADGFWEKNGRLFNERYVEVEKPVWIPDPRDNELYRRENENRYREENDERSQKENSKPNVWPEIKNKYFPSKRNSKQGESDIDLPSWVARASQAPFMLDHAPGMEMRKTSRANADPLVGSPQDGHRNYNAAGSETLELSTLKFKKRPVMGHYSLFVKGFELDVVEKVEDASQLGSIPRAWLELGGWIDLQKDPPNEFWRTIVADRGQDNRNPPYYYARACKESVHKGGHLGGSVNTAALINNEQNSIIAEFCRRVHAVIWNRCLFKTKGNRLGIASRVKEGDKVCILHGCTVPVILGQKSKEAAKFNKEGVLIKKAELTQEEEEDRIETLKSCIRRAVNNRERKAKYRPKKKEYMKTDVWQEMMDARQEYLKKRSEEKDKAKKLTDKQASEEKAEKDWRRSKSVLATRIKEAEEAKGIAESNAKKAKADKESAQSALRIAQADLRADLRAAHEAAADVATNEATSDNITPDVTTPPIEGPKAEEDAAKQALSLANNNIAPAQSAIDAAQSAIEVAQSAIDAAQSAIGAAERKKAAALQAAEDHAQKVTTGTAADEDGFFGSSDSGRSSSRESDTASSSTGSSGTSRAQAEKRKDTESPNDKEPWKQYWYEFKGECYLHGMMDGEAMKEKFYKDLKEWIFELR